MTNPDNVYIILKGTYYPGNVGSAARAMMNFGLKNMILVDPQCEFTMETYAKARYAAHIFEKAPVVNSIEEIINDFEILIGTSRRGQGRLHMRLSPKLSAREIADRYSNSRIGIIFGDEKAGLTNSDLEKCAWYVTIPSHPSFESLNLAHSVTIIAYEMFLTGIDTEQLIHKEQAQPEKVSRLFKHMVQFLKAIQFPERGSEHRVYSDLKRLLSSADLKRTDVNLLHGFMRYMEQKYLKKKITDF